MKSRLSTGVGSGCSGPCQIKERILSPATYTSNTSSIASEASPTSQKVAIRDFRYSQFPGRSQFDEIFTSLPLDCWDQSQALDVGGDDKFLMELAAVFSAACPALLKSLEDSIAPKNLSSLAPAFWDERRGRSTNSRGRSSFDKVRLSWVRRLTTIFADRYPSFSFA